LSALLVLLAAVVVVVVAAAVVVLVAVVVVVARRALLLRPPLLLPCATRQWRPRPRNSCSHLRVRRPGERCFHPRAVSGCRCASVRSACAPFTRFLCVRVCTPVWCSHGFIGAPGATAHGVLRRWPGAGAPRIVPAADVG
jgi:hypothetical protein